MNARVTIFLAFAVGLLSLATFSQAAQARVETIDHGGIYFDSVYIERGQIVEGDITVVGGDATVDGTIHGDLTVVGGSIDERPGSLITGRVQQGGGIARDIASDAGIAWKIGLAAVVLLFFLIFPLRTRMALDRLERHPGLCTAVGLVGWIAVVPIALLCAITVVLIPLIAVEIVAVVAGLFIGTAALALLVGRRLYEMMSPRTTAPPLLALLLGLALVTAAELVPVVGALIMVLVGMVGLGAAILAFVREESFTGVRPATPAGPPIGGPPMVIG
jgi:hypothetical protein